MRAEHALHPLAQQVEVHTFTLLPRAPSQFEFQLLNPGAVIWVWVGLNGDNTGDSFSMDFKIFYNETAF